jgi:hypothetical protein
MSQGANVNTFNAHDARVQNTDSKEIRVVRSGRKRVILPLGVVEISSKAHARQRET